MMTPSESVRFECISAVTLVTADMGRAVRFYESLGFRIRYGGEDATFTSFHVGQGYLNLMPGDPPRQLWGRVILYVSDVDAMYRQARSAGWRPAAEPTDASWGERFFHLQDPDGNELSFARPLADSIDD